MRCLLGWHTSGALGCFSLQCVSYYSCYVFHNVLIYPMINTHILTESVRGKKIRVTNEIVLFTHLVTHIWTSTLLKVTPSLKPSVHKNTISSKYSPDHAAERLMHITHYRLPLSHSVTFYLPLKWEHHKKYTLMAACTVYSGNAAHT